ncbi:TolC family protein [Helicobacter muridarum]|uniref:RND efflux system outer membrane lipoprotein CmeC n=1 Tax=Helicobacter muridarum TaxID=216 RepID=A0A377PS18_9HELI|nr:TolC family protein [Helicobacter muridarum]TLE00619.1 TolC family protein [Helicobacter muridarum]STQ85636.1 RND efflux system outer membrane lipoprotein CmeC [Helicobacter muridarum]
MFGDIRYKLSYMLNLCYIYCVCLYIHHVAFLAILCLAWTACVKLPTNEELALKTNVRNEFHNKEILKHIGDSNLDMRNLDYIQTFFALFPDPILEKIILQSLESNTNLLILESKIRQARATAKVNTWNLFPKANANLNYNYSDSNYQRIQTNVTQNTTNVALSFNWEVDIFGKLNALRLANKEQVLQSIQNLYQAQVVLIGDVANYYFLIRQIAQSILINEKITNNLEQIYLLTNQKYHLGLIGIDSVATTKSNYLSQKNVTLNLNYVLEQNKNALLLLLNKNELGFDIGNIDYIFNEGKIPSINSLSSSIVFNRPDVKSSVFALNSSLYQRHNKKMALFPNININGSLGQILFSPRNSLGDMVWQIASSLAMPLLNRQSITQDYIMSKEDTKQAFYTLQNTINTAVSEIENATKNMEITNTALAISQEDFANNKNTFEIMESRYKQNLIDDISRLEYANTYLRAKNSLLSAYLAQNQAVIAFYKAFGGNLVPSQSIYHIDMQRDRILEDYRIYESKKSKKEDIANDL